MTTPTLTPTAVRQSMPALASLGLAGFLAVTSEMLPVGLLPAIGTSFTVTESTTGLLVTVFAVMVALFAVPLTLATRRLPRKPLIIATIVGYLISNLLIAVAPTFGLVVVARVVGGLAHALFFSVCIGYVPKLIAKGEIGRGLAVVGAGTTAGFVLGVPLSTTLGSLVGWRNAFGTLVVVAAVVLVLIARLLPAVKGSAPGPAGHHVGARRDLAAVTSSNTLVFIGQYTVYTYITVVFLTAGAHESWTGPMLLLCGVCGLVGLMAVGRTVDTRPRATVLIVLGLLAAAILGVGASHQWLASTVVVAALWSGLFGGVPAMFQTTAVRALPAAPDVAGAWINATSNVGIALGAVIGGRLIESDSTSGYLAVVGAIFVLAGLGVAYASRRAFAGPQIGGEEQIARPAVSSPA